MPPEEGEKKQAYDEAEQTPHEESEAAAFTGIGTSPDVGIPSKKAGLPQNGEGEKQ